MLTLMARRIVANQAAASPRAPVQDRQAAHAKTLKPRRGTAPLAGRTVAVGKRADTPEQSDTARKYTPIQLADAKRRIEYLFVHGSNVRRIQERLLKGDKDGSNSYNLTKTFISRIIEEVKRELSEDAEAHRASYKATQIRRLYKYIEQAKDAGDFNALAKFEAMLADLQGTRDAIKHEHTVVQTKAMQIVFANADDRSLIEELQEALAEQQLVQAHRARVLTEGAREAEIIAAE